MATRSYTAIVEKEGNGYVALCPELDVASQGATEAEALKNLGEALELHFEPPRATLTPRIKKVEADIGAAP